MQKSGYMANQHYSVKRNITFLCRELQWNNKRKLERKEVSMKQNSLHSTRRFYRYLKISWQFNLNEKKRVREKCCTHFTIMIMNSHVFCRYYTMSFELKFLHAYSSFRDRSIKCVKSVKNWRCTFFILSKTLPQTIELRAKDTVHLLLLYGMK